MDSSVNYIGTSICISADYSILLCCKPYVTAWFGQKFAKKVNERTVVFRFKQDIRFKQDFTLPKMK